MSKVEKDLEQEQHSENDQEQEEPEGNNEEEDQAQDEEASGDKLDGEEEKEDQKDEPEPELAENTLAVNKSVSFVNDSEGQDSPPKKLSSKADLKSGKLKNTSIPNPILSANKPPKPKLPKDYELFDFIFPGGKLSKLCKVKQEKKMEPKIPEILESFKFKDPHPCLVLSGARDSQRGKLLAGVARAAFRSDAVILDSGIATGIENYCLRRSKGVA